MTPTEAPEVTKPGRYAADTWLRTIEFIDGQPDGGDDDPPCHIGQSVWINGERTNLRISTDRPVRVESNGGLGRSETLASFVIHRDDVTLPNYDGNDGEVGIGTWKTLIPPGADEAHRWRRVSFEDRERIEIPLTDEDKAEGITAKSQEGPLPPEVEDESSEWVRVWFMARAVGFPARP